MLDIRKWFERWKVKDPLELSGDTIKYVIIEDRLIEAPRMKLKYYIAKMLKCQHWNITLQMLNVGTNTGKNAKTYPTTCYYPHDPWNSKSLGSSLNSLTKVRC